MRDRHADGLGRPSSERSHRTEHHHGGRHHGHHRHHRGGRHGGRLFDYGDLRFLLLALIAEQPSHGYELIRAIEERYGGSYTPSPGVIYPTLSWLDDMGYASVEAEESGRKRYRITEAGAAFLAENRARADDLLSRAADSGNRGEPPAPVVRAMENLKLALRLRFKRGPLDQVAAESIASALDTAAQAVERS